MKFDCILTNPPFQDSAHKEKKNTLWRKWIDFMPQLVSEDGIFSLVIPSSWMGSDPLLKKNFLKTNEKSLKYNLTYLNRDECRKHFIGIGSTFSYFVMENKPYKGKTNLVSKNINGDIDVSNSINLNDSLVDVFPRDLSSIGLSIIKKTLMGGHLKLGIKNNTFNHSVHKKKWRLNQSEEFTYPIQNTPKKLYWYNYPHPDQGKLKLLIPTTTYFRVQSVTTHGVTQSFCYFLIDEGIDPNIVLNNVNNKLFDYLNECFRYANWNSVNLLRNLPSISFDRELSDSDIFDYFKITKQEINHINKLITWR